MDSTILKFKDSMPFLLRDISCQRKLSFCVWLTEYLYKHYGVALCRMYLNEVDLNLDEVLGFLWYMIGRVPSEFDMELTDAYLEKLMKDELHTTLDQDDANEIGQCNLILAFYYSLTYLKKHDDILVIELSFLPLFNIECFIENSYEEPASAETTIKLLQVQELAVQLKMINCLTMGKNITVEGKDQFREKMHLMQLLERSETSLPS